MKSRKVLIVAGEASGDIHAANLVMELKRMDPGLSFFGMGGPRMEKSGVELVSRFEELSIVGFAEVVSKLGAVKRTMSALWKETLRRRPDMAVFVDYPGFNLRFAALSRESVPKLFYYILPQIWVWGRWRGRTICRLFDALISVIPFECPLYEDSRLRCRFVGHPVLDLVRPAVSKEEFRSQYCPGRAKLLGIVPGSRREEVRRILPVMLECAKLLKAQLAETRCVIAVADTIDTGLVKAQCKGIFDDVSVVKGMTYDLMQASDFLLVASGTATLEAAILGTPLVIVYRTSLATWAIVKAIIKTRHVGLVNIIAGRGVVPEFIQFAAKPERIAREILSLLSDAGRLSQMKSDLADVKVKLGTPGASRRAAELILELSGDERCKKAR